MWDISERCMTVNLRVSMWAGERIDRVAGHRLADANDAKREAVSVTKKLIHPDYLKELRRHIERVRYVWTTNTLPWKEDGSRIMRSEAFLDFNDTIAEPLAAFARAADDFAANYEEIARTSRDRLGLLALEEDYPHPSRVRDMFDIKLSYEPVSTDWRVKLDKEQISFLEAQLQANLNEGLATAMAELRDQIEAEVVKMRDRVQDAEDGGPRIIRTDALEWLGFFANRIERLNITEDPEVAKVAKEIRTKLLRYTADELREDKSRRDYVAKNAEKILDTLGKAA